MPITTLVAYAPDALVYNSSAGTWTLRADFNPVNHRVEINFNDDDNILDGDSPGDEVGTDTNQTAVINDMLGNPVSSGVIYNEEYYQITMPSGSQYIDVLEVGGIVVGYLATDALQPGVSYPVTAIQDVDAASAYAYSAYYDVACFTPGTLISTADGDLPVEWIAEGDRVVTRDRGLQVVREVQYTRQSKLSLAVQPHLWPVALYASALGLPGPGGHVGLSPQHSVLVRHGAVEFLFGHREVLVPVGFLASPTMDLVPEQGLTYYHLRLDRHDLVRANGFWCESLFPAFDPDAPAARPRLRRWEALALKPYLNRPAAKARRAA